MKIINHVYWRKVGTAAYERPLLGLISMGSRVSVKTLAQVTNTSVPTVMRQLYWWAFTGQHLTQLRKVNWKWNRDQVIPERMLQLFNNQPADREQLFKRAVVRELQRQADLGYTPKIKALSDVLFAYM